MTARLRTFVANAALVFVSISLFVLLAEGAARLVYAGLGAPQWNHRDFRMTRPPPYADAAYFSADFVRESFEQPGGHKVPAGTRLVIPNDFSGKWFNVRDGKRVTTGIPSDPSVRVMIFGGSTVYCSEVPDDLTLPSALQARLNSLDPGRYAVHNFGVTSVNARQQLERLLTLELLPTDIVVFFDGVNDIYNGVLLGRPKGWIVGENQNVLATLPAWRAWLFRRTMRLSERFHVLRPLVRGDKLAMPPHIADRLVLNANLEAMQSGYFETISLASQHVEAIGARFVHFVQPNLYVQNELSTYEASLATMPLIVVPGSSVAFREGTPRLRAASSELRAAGVKSFELTDALSEREPGEELYLDAVHVAHAGNARLAKIIADTLVAPRP
jgi:lysophospholipase L1-like esterase